MKPTQEEMGKILDNLKEIGTISLDIIYSSEETKEKAKKINRKAYETWTKIAKMMGHRD